MSSEAPIVHVVAKTHLDLGFTGLAAEVSEQYCSDFFPRAIATARALAVDDGAQLVWTTGSWILHHALAQDHGTSVAAAIEEGILAWHALPVTTHTELMDVALVRSGLGISQELDARFARRTTAAKMTDVPGHTRGLVSLLDEADVTFLHLGVNPAWPLPEVPATFRWQAPDGAQIVVMYEEGGYGGERSVPGCDDVLTFLHAGDNLGPPSADEVRAFHADLAVRYPGAEVRASTLDAFARRLARSGAAAALPVVTAEIGDPWLFGAGSDPQKVHRFRELLEWRRRFGERLGTEVLAELDRSLLLVAEHTWGLDQKVVLPVEQAWDRDALSRLRHSAAGRRFEASWAEQRAILDQVVQRLTPIAATIAPDGSEHGPAMPSALSDGAIDVPDASDGPLGPDGAPGEDYVAVVPDGTIGWRTATSGASARPGDERGWDVALDPATGALIHLRHRGTGRELADADHPLGLVTHQTFDEADYERFYRQLSPTEDDEWWARRDNTKPGIDAAGARSERRAPRMIGAWTASRDGGASTELLIRLGYDDDRRARFGAPDGLWVRWSWQDAGNALTCSVWWRDKVATRLPEATWVSFSPKVAEPQRWELDKLGQRVSPLDVVRRGGRSLHAVGEGMHYSGPDGHLTIATPDAPLVAPGAPNLLDADPPLPDLDGGFHVLLHDNCWGTNFPMWNEGPAAFEFTVGLS